MAVGPWVVGTIIEDKIGAIFAWGVVVSGRYIPSQVPYAYFFVHFTFCHPALVLLYGHVLDCRTYRRGLQSRIINWKTSPLKLRVELSTS